jgi:hypothetical protein
MKKTIIIMVAVAVVAAAGGFFGGMKYQQTRKVTFKTGDNLAAIQRQNGAQTNRNGQNSGFVNGEVISQGEKSVTVKTQDGGSKVVFYSDSTTIGKTTDGVVTDLEVGKTIMVTGTANSDGSVAAKNIQIRSANEMVLPQGGNPPSGQ